jgi:hypothetical protein
MPRRWSTPSPALVIALLALFVALGSGAYAVTKIGTKQLKNGAVTKPKLRNKAVGTNKLANGAVSTLKLNQNARTLWAAVQSDGTVASQSGNITVVAQGGGSYEIAFPQDVSGRALIASGINGRVIATAILCNGGTGVGTDCSPTAPNDGKHAFVNTALAVAAPATFTNLPFYVAALPK